MSRGIQFIIVCFFLFSIAASMALISSVVVANPGYRDISESLISYDFRKNFTIAPFEFEEIGDRQDRYTSSQFDIIDENKMAWCDDISFHYNDHFIEIPSCLNSFKESGRTFSVAY